MTESWLGLAFGLGPLAVMVSLPFWGSVSDVTGRSDRVIQLTAVLAGLSGLVLFFAESVLGVLLLVPLFYAFEYAIEPMANAAVLNQDTSGSRSGTFGKRRLWGSLGFIVGAALGGLVTYVTSWPVLFLFFLGVMVTLAIRANQIGDLRSSSLSLEQYVRSFLQVIKSPRLQLLLLFLVLWSIPFSGNFMAFSWYWTQVGGSSLGLGLAWGLAAFLEVPLYWLTVRYWDRLWLEGLLVLSPAVAALRWFLYLVYPEPEFLMVIQLLHGLMFVSFSVGSVYLIDMIAEAGVRNTGQGLLGASVFGLGAALGNLLAGNLYGAFGASTFYVSLIAVDVLALFVILVLILYDSDHR